VLLDLQHSGNERNTTAATNIMTDEEEEQSTTCPVCWISSSDTPSSDNNQTITTEATDPPLSAVAVATSESPIIFAKTPCNHIYCLSCIERVLLPDIATGGTCPMCRTAVSIFDLRNAATSSTIYPSNPDVVSSWSISNKVYKQYPNGRNAGRRVLQRMMAKTDSIFQNKFCFEQDQIPKLQFHYSAEEGQSSDSLDDLKSYDFRRFHFHPQSLTFHGKIDFDTPISRHGGDSYTYSSFDCLLQFSEDGEYVRDGYIQWGYSPTATEEYPLDGKWQVTWEGRESIDIYVQKHYFNCQSIDYQITLDEKHRPKFEWPLRARGLFRQHRKIVQQSNIQILPGSEGPGVGEILEWTTNLASHSRITWKRISMNLSPKTDGRRLRINPDLFVYRNVDFQEQLPLYIATSLWGNTFCQAYTIGLASYHFEQNADNEGDFRAYISYEHRHTSAWPSLDNGEDVPDRVPFRNIEWDPEERIFKGDICWQEDYGTTWMGEDKWHYEIKFDPKFMFILSGTCTRSNSEDPHKFGQDLVYVNAALESILRDIRETVSTTGQYLDVVRKWRQDGASGPTLDMLGEISMAVLDDNDRGEGSTVFDFNLYR
jgi:hypothetical protein